MQRNRHDQNWVRQRLDRNSQFSGRGSTNLRDVLGVRRGGVGGDGATGQGGKGLAAQRRSLTGRVTEEHDAGSPIVYVRRDGEGDSDTFPMRCWEQTFPIT